MRFFVFLLFLVSLLSVSGCKQENPEITKLWEQYETLWAEAKEISFDEDRAAERKAALSDKRDTILEKIVEIDPDALYVAFGADDGTKIADLLEQSRQAASIRESEQKIRDMGN